MVALVFSLFVFVFTDISPFSSGAPKIVNNEVMPQNSLHLNSNVFMRSPKRVVCISRDLE
jgi:hypothetical protein